MHAPRPLQKVAPSTSQAEPTAVPVQLVTFDAAQTSHALDGLGFAIAWWTSSMRQPATHSLRWLPRTQTMPSPHAEPTSHCVDFPVVVALLVLSSLVLPLVSSSISVARGPLAVEPSTGCPDRQDDATSSMHIVLSMHVECEHSAERFVVTPCVDKGDRFAAWCAWSCGVIGCEHTSRACRLHRAIMSSSCALCVSCLAQPRGAFATWCAPRSRSIDRLWGFVWLHESESNEAVAGSASRRDTDEASAKHRANR